MHIRHVTTGLAVEKLEIFVDAICGRFEVLWRTGAHHSFFCDGQQENVASFAWGGVSALVKRLMQRPFTNEYEGPG